MPPRPYRRRPRAFAPRPPTYSAPPEVLAHSEQNKDNLERLINKRLKHLATVVPRHAPELDLPKPRRYRVDEYGERWGETKALSVDSESEAETSTAEQDSDSDGDSPERAVARPREAATLATTPTAMDLPVRYSKSCTACITQGFECSGHKPICSQCYYSSARYTRSIVRPRDYGLHPEDIHGGKLGTAAGQHQDTTVEMCSYPVEGPPLIPRGIYRRLTAIAKKLDQLPPAADKSHSRTEVWGEAVKSVTMVPIKEENNNSSNDDPGRSIETGSGEEERSSRRRRGQDAKSHQPHWQIFYRGIPAMDRNPAATVDYVLQSRSNVIAKREREILLGHHADLISEGWNDKKRNRKRRIDTETAAEDSDANVEVEKKKMNLGPQIVDKFLLDSNSKEQQRHQNLAFRTDWMPLKGDHDVAFFRNSDGPHAEERVTVGLSRETQEALRDQELRYGFQSHNYNALATATATALKDNEYWSGYHSKPKSVIEKETAMTKPQRGNRGISSNEFRVKKRKDGLLPEHVPQYRTQMTETYRPWVPKADDYVIPSACDIPETSFLRALHFYASYYYTHTNPCPDVFEAMDLTSHIALGMIIQETISDFAFKLGKEGQMEDCEVYAEKEEWMRLQKEEQEKRSSEEESAQEGHSLDHVPDMNGNGNATTVKDGSMPSGTSQSGAWTRFSHRSGRLSEDEEEDEDEEDFESDGDLQLSDQNSVSDSGDNNNDSDGNDDIETQLRRPAKKRRVQVVDCDFWPSQSSLEETMKWSHSLSSGQHYWHTRRMNAAPAARRSRAQTAASTPSREVTPVATLSRETTPTPVVPPPRVKARAANASRGRGRPRKQQAAAVRDDTPEDDTDGNRREEEEQQQVETNAQVVAEEHGEEEEQGDQADDENRDAEVGDEQDEGDVGDDEENDLSLTRENTIKQRSRSMDNHVQMEVSDSDSNSDHEEQENNAKEYTNSEKPLWEPVISSRYESLFGGRGQQEDEDEDQDEDEGMRAGQVISQVVENSSSEEDEEVVGPSEAEESDEY
ncbi:hypothetical protein EMPS_09585 [Entomortierella parvispora]|uniref:Uncharacterized protein n=1 Tax=Entomortierella parvispora TaxID=205924 RepID=A0A9P3HIG8_9FUNG|nr:hypothetical protein EMPS_09585 [Entomortierella parvispora]